MFLSSIHRNTTESAFSPKTLFTNLLLLILSFISMVLDFYLEMFGAISLARVLPVFRTSARDAQTKIVLMDDVGAHIP